MSLQKKTSDQVHLHIPEHLENLIRSEAMERNKTIRYIIIEKLEKAYMNGTSEHKKLNKIAEILCEMKGEELSDLFRESENLFDQPSIPESQIRTRKNIPQRTKSTLKRVSIFKNRID